MKRHLLRWGCVLVLLLLGACAKQVEIARCSAPEDNPSHHVVRGMENLEAEELEAARSKFDRALYCDADYAPAQAGRALVYAMQAARQTEDGYRQADVKQAMDALKAARRQSRTREDEFIYHTTAIRVHTAVQGKKWLQQAEQHFRKSQQVNVNEQQLPYYQGREAAAYFMGVAYYRGARDFAQARALFRQVLDAKRHSRWHDKADQAWQKADKIARATAGLSIGNVGQQIALQDRVSRGDLAALLVDELHIDNLFAGRIPVQSQVKQQQAPFTPADVKDNPFQQEILTLMKWNIRGLQPAFDQATRAPLFYPKEAVSRKALAIVLEDVLIKLTGNDNLASEFLGQTTSPYPDVGPTVSWFNAVMTVVTRNLMETTLAGEFRPNDPADGAEVLLATRVLKQRLNQY